MFRQKYAERLDEEPITVSIGQDETFILRPMDPFRRPSKSEVRDVLALMKTRQDWQNIIPFLQGLRIARFKLDSDQWEKIIRKAGEADALGIIIECAKQSDRTGLHLNHIGVVRRLFSSIHRNALLADFEEQATRKALRLANQTLTLMEAPEHAVREVERDPKRQPAVIGVLLGLSAVRAVNHCGGSDADGLVRKYAERLLATWSLGKFTTDSKRWADLDRKLLETASIHHAIKLALQVNGIAANKSIGGPLKARRQEIGKVVQELQARAPQEVKEKPTVGYAQSLQLGKL